MLNTELHSSQVAILQTLRRSQSARYSQLMRPTGMSSDIFKFHVRKLQTLGYVSKLEDGEYALTPSGKEYANNLDETRRTTQKQPKLSIMMIVSRTSPDSQTEYLFQERHRNPYWGYWGFLSGPAQWGEAFKVTAQAELRKQTGLQADFTIKSFYRQSDHNQSTKELLEDKLFILAAADKAEGELANDWSGGTSLWLTVDKLVKSNHKVFASTQRVIDLLQSGKAFDASQIGYSTSDY